MMYGSNDCYSKTWQGPDHFVRSYVVFSEEMIRLVGNDINNLFLLTPPPLYPRSSKMDYERGNGACDENMRN